MKRVTLKTVTFGGAASVLAGLFIGTAGMFLFVWLFMVTGLAFLVWLLAATTDRETGRNTRQPTLLVFSGLLLSLVIAGGMMRRQEGLQHEEADRMVSTLEQYRRDKGRYPATLDGLSVRPRHIIPTYTVDSSGSQCKFEYWSISCFNHYNSQTKEWIAND